MNKFLLTIVLFFFAHCVTDAQVIFSENFGTPSGSSTSILSYSTGATPATFQNASSLTFSGNGEVRNTQISSGYLNASGNGNAYLLGTSETILQISGINTSTFASSSLFLSFGIFKERNSANGSDLLVEISSNGVDYTTLSYSPLSTGTGSQKWYLRTTTGTIPSVPNLSLRFRNTGATATTYRIDDIELSSNNPPTNDEPCFATALPAPTAVCTYTNSSTQFATASTGVPAPSCTTNALADVWFSVVVPSNGVIAVKTQAGTMTDGVMTVYRGTTCNSLTEIGCNDNGVDMPLLTLTGQTPGSTLWIRVWGWSASDAGSFGICATSPVLPANDEPCNATALPTLTTTCTYYNSTTENASVSSSAPSTNLCSTTQRADVWFSVVVPSNGVVIVKTQSGTLTDAVMSIYRGTCGSLTEINCNDNGSGMPQLTLSGQTPGNTLWIRVWGWSNSDVGTFGICAMTNPNPPSNDICSNATSIANNACINGTTVNANDNVNGTAGCQSGTGDHPDVWYSFVSTGTQAQISVTTSAPFSDDVELVLYSGTCGSLTVVNNKCGPSPLTATFSGLTSGVTYYYLVSNTSSGTAGPFQTCASTSTPLPVSGQDCSTAAILCNGSTFSQSTSNAGFGSINEVTLTNSCFGLELDGSFLGERQSKWFKFTVGKAGKLRFNINPINANNDYDWALWDVTAGCSLTATNLLSCNWEGFLTGVNGSTGMATNSCKLTETGATNINAWQSPINVTAGNVYVLLIDNYSTSNSGFTLKFGGTGSATCTNGNATIGPTSGFTFPNTCAAYTFTKTDATTNSMYLWNFGDGTTSTALNPIHTYTANGSYTATLSITDALGCSSVSSNTITVNYYPALNMTVTSKEICSSSSSQNVSFPYTVSSGLPTTYSIAWNPPSPFTAVTNATLTGGNITCIVPANTPAGIYSGTLTVKNACTYTSAAIPITIKVNTTPTISAITAATPVCFSTSLQSSNLTYSAVAGSPTTYNITWSASPSNSLNAISNAVLSSSPIEISVPANTQPGTYSGTLTVSNANCTSPANNFSLIVKPSPSAVISVRNATGILTPPYTICNGSSLTLSNVARTDSVYYNRDQIYIFDNTLLSSSNSFPDLNSLSNAGYRGSNIPISFPSSYNPLINAGNLPVVNINVKHQRPQDLKIFLVHKATSLPDVVIPLCLNRNLAAVGSNFDSTIFSMNSASLIENASASFRGTYKPEGDFITLIGRPMSGFWYIRMGDNALGGGAGAVNYLDYWSIKFGDEAPDAYSWSTGESTNTIVVNPSTTSIYNLTVSNTFGCSSQSSINVNVTQPPNAGNLSGDQNVCVGSTTNFTSDVSGGIWSSPLGSTIASVSPLGVVTGFSQGTETMTFTVSGTGVCANATVTATRTVTVNSPPLAGVVSGSDAICMGASTTLNTTGSLGGWNSSNDNIATINSFGEVSAVSPGSVSIVYTATGTGGCSNVPYPPFSFTVNENPTVNVTTSSTCVGGSAIVTANPTDAQTYNYVWTVPSGVTNPLGNVAQFSTNIPGLYTVIINNPSTGCSSNQVTENVTFNQTPDPPELSGGSSLCLTSTNFSLEPSILGGIFASSNTSVATVDPLTGDITPIGQGSTNISYTIGSGACQGTATQPITITAPPIAGNLSGSQNICSNGSTALSSTVPGGTWSSGNESIATINALGIITPASTAINGTVTMTYTVAGTGGCAAAVETIDVTITTLPTAGTLSGDQSICSNGSSVFIAPNASDQGVWSSSNTSVASIDATTGVITPVSAGSATITYTVAGTGGCSNATSTRTVTVTAAPNAGTISGATSICTNSSPVFTTNGNVGGSWSSDNTTVASINSATGVLTPNISGAANVSYTVTGTGGCSNVTTTIPISITTSPNAGNIIGSTAICSNGTTALSSTGNTGGTWTSSNASVAGINTTTGSVTAVGAGTATMTYTVTGTGGCANATSTTLVTVTAAPNAGAIGGSSSVCLNSTATINTTANGGSWSSNNTNIAIINPTSGVITPIATGTATMSYTIAGTGGCSDAVSSTDINVISQPNASIVNNTGTSVITCAQPSIDVVASGAGTYLWSNGLGTSANQSIISAGNYILTVTGTNGCTSTASINITQNTTAPTAGITNNSGTTQITCSQPSISLTAIGGSTYSWNNGLGNNATVSIGTSGTYIVTATGTNGCTSSAQVLVTVSSGLPTAIITNLTGANELNCIRNSINLTATGGVSYSWSNGLGNNANATVTNPGTYAVTVTASNGCTATTDILITENFALPNAGINNNNNTTVLTCTQPSISLTATGGATFSWSNGLGNVATVNVGAAGNYVVTVTGANGCSSTAQIDITASSDLPVASIQNNTGQTTLDCNTTQINIQAQGGNTYSWSNGLGNNATVNIITPGSYTVTVTGPNGCSATSQVNITQDITTPNVIILNNSNSTVLNCNHPTISLSALGGVTYNWNQGLGSSPDVTISVPGNYSVAVSGANGCASDAQIDITQGQTTAVASSFTASACGTYNLPWGEIASTSGDYVHTYTTTQGCDSLVTANITIDASGVSTSFAASSCSTYLLPWGATVTSTGTYTHIYTTTQGCDSLVTANITIDASGVSTSFAASSCSTYLLPWGATATSTGTYTHVYSTTQGCDSLVTANITIDASGVSTSFAASSCSTYLLPWGATATSTGIYTHTYSTTQGCDSLVTANITIDPSGVSTSFAASSCSTYLLPWGATVTSTGTYTHIYTTTQGCDSLVTANITIDASGVSTSFAASSCSTYLLPWGATATSTGTYTHVYSTTQGCDSLVTANITIDPSGVSTSFAASSCSTYLLPWGATATSTGTYTHVYTTTQGCDSLVTATITIDPSGVSTSFAASSCSTYLLPWGANVTSTGTYTHVYTTTQGCDSLVTANITIDPSGVSTSFSASSCSSYALPWGDVVTSSGPYTHTYTTTQGCDSTVTANITIGSTVESVFNPVNICSGANYQLPNVSNNGITGSWSPAFDNTTSATYQFTPDAGQCAQATSLNVVVNPGDPQPVFNPIDGVCSGTAFTLPTLSNNGISGTWSPAINTTSTTTYTFTPTSGQCPVNTEMLVVVNPLPEGNFNASQNSICEGDSVQLTAAAADSYQWYYNGNILPGATGANYFATLEGDYTVAYISDSGCRAMATQVATLTLTRKPDAVFAAQSSCPQKPITFSSQSVVSSSLPVNYTWDFGNGQISNQQQDITSYAVGGSYNVTLTVTPDACPQLADSVTRSVIIYDPRPGIRYNPIDAVVHEPLNLLARAPGRSYLWTPSTGLNSDIIRNPVLDPTREVTFTIRISDLNGCETVDTQFVRIHKNTDIQVPQVFTPNGDGNNDLLYPFIIGMKTLKYFRVYNRWGNLLFESNDWNASKGWDGTLRGKPQPAETYIWVAEGTDVEGKLIKKGGNVILVR